MEHRRPRLSSRNANPTEATDPYKDSPHLQAILLGHWRNNPIQAQILDELSIVIGNVPDGNYGDAKLGIRPSITGLPRDRARFV